MPPGAPATPPAGPGRPGPGPFDGFGHDEEPPFDLEEMDPSWDDWQ
ncbi:hypothetical protein ACM614_08925 [Streptomyces sp. 12297]